MTTEQDLIEMSKHFRDEIKKKIIKYLNYKNTFV